MYSCQQRSSHLVALDPVPLPLFAAASIELGALSLKTSLADWLFCAVRIQVDRIQHFALVIGERLIPVKLGACRRSRGRRRDHAAVPVREAGAGQLLRSDADALILVVAVSQRTRERAIGTRRAAASVLRQLRQDTAALP